MRAQATDAGLITRGGRCLPWDEVYHVEWRRRCGLVATSAGVVKVDRATAEAVEQRIARQASEGSFWPAFGRGCGFRVGADALVVVHGRRAHRHPWAEVGIALGDGAAGGLRAGGRRWSLRSTQDAAGLVAEMDARLRAGAPLCDADGALTAAAVERYLGVEPGGTLTCRFGWKRLLGSRRLAGLALVTSTFVGLLWHLGKPLGIAISQAVPLAFVLAGLASRTSAVRADANGLCCVTAGRRERYAWSEVRSIQRTVSWVIETDRGPVKLSEAASNATALASAIQRILAARDAGVTLPSEVPLPDTALSRLSGEDAADGDRGLSVSTTGDDESGPA